MSSRSPSPGPASDADPLQVLIAAIDMSTNGGAGTATSTPRDSDSLSNNLDAFSTITTPSSPGPDLTSPGPFSLDDMTTHNSERGVSVQPAPAPQAALNINIAQIAKKVKRARKLGPQADTELDIFLAGNALEREALQYGAALECRELLQTLTRDVEYTIPETLKKTAQDYTWGYMLSAAITSYWSTDAATRVLRVMRDLNIANIPPTSETGRCDIITAHIGKALTDCRHHIKNKVNETLKPDTRVAKDIASLTAAIIGRSRVKATAALYVRLADIRWAVIKYPKFKEEAFWIKFDQVLAQQLDGGRALEITRKIYDDDVQTYGQPDLRAFPIINPDRQEEWVTALGESSAQPSQNKETTRRRKRA